MSYVVKGDIPNKCSRCPQRTLYRGINVCLAAKKMKVSSSEKQRHQQCPLVDLPKNHGRLIDADRLLAVLKSMASTNQSVPTEAVLGLIDNQPVIVEKERNE